MTSRIIFLRPTDIKGVIDGCHDKAAKETARDCHGYAVTLQRRDFLVDARACSGQIDRIRSEHALVPRNQTATVKTRILAPSIVDSL